MLEFCHDAAEKTSIFCICCSKICKLQIKFLSLHRQWLSIDYPGKFPERASRIRHYPFKDHQMVVFYYFLKLFIIIFRKPLLVAILRLIEISFLPKKIN